MPQTYHLYQSVISSFHLHSVSKRAVSLKSITTAAPKQSLFKNCIKPIAKCEGTICVVGI